MNHGPSTDIPLHSARTGRTPRPQKAMASILIVEDDADIRESLGEALELDGYLVTRAENGREALRMLRAGLTPAVILLDLVMPVMSGWQFRQVQLADPALAGIPVVVVSASAPGDARPDRHLRKPFGIDDLLSAIATLSARD